ncbi:MAG: orotidine-5'-phosphate decarboxylase [Planctomycetes bacterium]|nr:orotidine-5'-phosphate decarboxylase [Planctomycetota bacterium]
MGQTAFERIAARVRDVGAPVVLGLDPRPDRMPPSFRDGVDGVRRFHSRLLELIGDLVVAVKPQIAFFEAFGEDGLRAWADTCALVKERDLVVIGDVKRGDIGSTAEAYAKVHFRWADILTVHPLLGDDSIEPFLRPCRDEGKGIFLLCATSNPGWSRFQAIEDRDGVPLWARIAEAIEEWNASCPSHAGYGPVGAVVGATHPEILARVRELAPSAWLLLPGVGAQGATIEEVLSACDTNGLGALVPVSRGIASCFDPEDPDWETKVRQGAEALVAAARKPVDAHRSED